MFVEGAEFLHFHYYKETGPLLHEKYLYTIGPGPNFFWQYYLQHEITYPKEPYQGKFAWKLAELHAEAGLFQNLELTKSVYDFLQYSVSEMGMFLREMVFEEIRRAKYPQLPSRRICMWLVDAKCQDHWRARLGKQKHVLYRVSCTGNIHKGSSKFLNSDSMNYNEYQQNAEAYWQSLGCDDDDHEYLFVGDVKIIESVEEQQAEQ